MQNSEVVPKAVLILDLMRQCFQAKADLSTKHSERRI